MSKGTVIIVPVVSSDRVTIEFYNSNYNYGGYRYSDISNWLENDVINMLPYGLRNTIIPVYKRCQIGDQGYATAGYPFNIWLFSGVEIGASYSDSNRPPYISLGTQYPIFTNNSSRIRAHYDTPETAENWHTRTLGRVDPWSYFYVNTSGAMSANDTSWYLNTHGTSFGFCSGEIPEEEGGE